MHESQATNVFLWKNFTSDKITKHVQLGDSCTMFCATIYAHDLQFWLCVLHMLVGLLGGDFYHSLYKIENLIEYRKGGIIAVIVRRILNLK